MKLYFNLFEKIKEIKTHYAVNNIETFNVGDEVYPINVRNYSGSFKIGDKARIRRININISEEGIDIEYTFEYTIDKTLDIGFVNYKNVFKTKEELLKFIKDV